MGLEVFVGCRCLLGVKDSEHGWMKRCVVFWHCNGEQVILGTWDGRRTDGEGWGGTQIGLV